MPAAMHTPQLRCVMHDCVSKTPKQQQQQALSSAHTLSLFLRIPLESPASAAGEYYWKRQRQAQRAYRARSKEYLKCPAYLRLHFQSSSW